MATTSSTDSINENLNLCEINRDYQNTSSIDGDETKSTIITKTTIGSNITRINHQQEQKIRTPKALLFNKILEEEVWFSGSELKTDNSSSDDGENNDDIRVLRKSMSISDESTKSKTNKKGAKRKTSRKSLSSSSIKNIGVRNIGIDICEGLANSTHLSKKVSTHQKALSSSSSSNFDCTSTNEMVLKKLSTSSSISKMATIITSSSAISSSSSSLISSTSSRKVLEKYENLSKSSLVSSSTVETSAASDIQKTTAIGAAATETVSHSSQNAVEWRPKRGSVSLPGLSTELEQILHI